MELGRTPRAGAQDQRRDEYRRANCGDPLHTCAPGAGGRRGTRNRGGCRSPGPTSSCGERVRLAVILRRACTVTRNTTSPAANPFSLCRLRHAIGCHERLFPMLSLLDKNVKAAKRVLDQKGANHMPPSAAILGG